MQITPGSHLGPYEIISLAGVGGMGEVYKAKDTRLNRTVAIKILPEQLANSSDSRKRFESEARTISTLNHPNICTLYDIGSQDGQHYIVMEYLEGETLRSHLKSGAQSVRRVIELASQIASGLAAAHEKGIIHRDLKPENIFLTSGDRIKLLDFGLAHATETVSAPEVSMTPTRSRMTDPGMVMGTVGYMSPEQVRGQQADARSDIFSFGAVLYEMLNGQRAFHRETSAETMTAILKEDPPEFELNINKIPPALKRIVQRCLEKKPELRFQSPQDLAFALEMSSGQSVAIPQPVHSPAAAKNILKRILTALLIVASAIGGFLIAKSSTKNEPLFFKQLTFRKGFIQSANFTPDGTTIVYGCALNGGPIQLYSGRTDSIESRLLELPPADVLGISRTGDMAVLLNRHYRGTWITVGTLAKAPIAGGSPREILQDINDGDISPDGNDFCIVRDYGAIQRLEYPIGKLLFETFGWISYPRISSDGKRIAFLDHPIYGDDRGYVAIVENGKVTRVSDEYSGLTGLALAPSGEIWFSGSKESEDAGIWAVQPGKNPKLLLRAPIDLRIASVNSTGEAMIVSGERRAELAGLIAGDTTERDLSWYGDEDIVGISADATMIAASQTSQGSGTNYQIYFRRADGSARVQIGEGNGEAVSNDGKWIFATIPSEKQNKIVVYPTGPGEKKIISTGDIELSASKGSRLFCTSADGKRIAFLGHAPNQPLLAYVLDLWDGKPRAVTTSETINFVLSPDGNSVLAKTKNSPPMIFPVNGGKAIPANGLLPEDFPIQWHNAGNSVFVWDRSFPAKVYKVDLITGKRELWKEMSPADRNGVLYGRIFMTPDGMHYIYRYRRNINRLYLAKGLH